MTHKFARWNESLPCPLTEDELRQKGNLLAQLHADYARTEREKKAAMEQFKKELGDIDGKVAETARNIRSKTEPRMVECYEAGRYERNVVEVIRNDTGEVVKTRGMRPEERQTNITDISEANNP